MGVDERVDRIVGMAMAHGGAHAFLQRLTDSIGGRVTGSIESRAAADLLLATLREAGFEDARFEEYPLESRWQRGRAVGRVVSPVAPDAGRRVLWLGAGHEGRGNGSLVRSGRATGQRSVESPRTGFEGRRSSSSRTRWKVPRPR